MICQPEFTEMEFRLLRDFIHDCYGIFFKEDKRGFIKMKLSARVASLGFTNFSEYLQYLKYGEDHEHERGRMISLLTNNETYFFREMPQLTVYRDQLLPRLRDLRQNRERRIRVLSAGCSTGEEVYTLAMLTFETGNFFWGWDVKITGLDVDEQAVGRAREGAYLPRSFRMTEGDYLEKFFSPNGGDYIVKGSLRQITEFRRGNITDPRTWDKIEPQDIVFCRNVLIYFSEPKVREVLAFFHGILNPGGYLFLGHSESLTGMLTDFQPMRFPETIIYRKRD